jgi:hypothetical protein
MTLLPKLNISQEFNYDYMYGLQLIRKKKINATGHVNSIATFRVHKSHF